MKTTPQSQPQILTPSRLRYQLSLPNGDRTHPTSPSRPCTRSRALHRHHAVDLPVTLFPSPILVATTPVISDDIGSTVATAATTDVKCAAGKLEDILVIPGMLRNMKAVKPCEVNFPTFQPETGMLERDLTTLSKLNSGFSSGLAHSEFQSLITKCSVCAMYMTRRTVDYHRCGAVRREATTTGLHSPSDKILFLYSYDIGGGLTETEMEELLAFCFDCKRFMTRSAGRYHDCVFDKWMESEGNLTLEGEEEQENKRKGDNEVIQA